MLVRILSVFIVLSLLAGRASSEIPGSAKIPLSSVLAPDGTFNLSKGVSGSLDMTGFGMTTSSDGKPRFVPVSSNTMAARSLPAGPESDSSNVYWDDQFGWAGVEGEAYAAVTDEAGNLYVAGCLSTAGNVPVINVAKWDGTSWSALGKGLGITWWHCVSALAVRGTDLYAAGEFSMSGNQGASSIVKWDGSSWTQLGSEFTYGADSATIKALGFANDDLYAAGRFTAVGGVSANNIARWDGTSWSSLGTGTDDVIKALAANGTDLYVGGYFSSAGGVPATSVAKWDGISWSSVASCTAVGVSALAVSGGMLYAVGSFDLYESEFPCTVAKCDGTSWTPLAPTTPSAALDAIAVNGGDVYVANYYYGPSIAKWDGSSWSTLDEGINDRVFSLAMSGDDLYVAGAFSRAGTVAAASVAKWDGTTWSSLGNGPNCKSSPVATFRSRGLGLTNDGNHVYFGGSVDSSLDHSYWMHKFARWDGSSWSQYAVDTNKFDNVNNDNMFRAMAVLGGCVVLGNTLGVDIWNGDLWTELGGSNTRALATMGSDLYVGRNTSELSILKWNESGWYSLGEGVNGGVYAVAASGSDLYVGGSFTVAGAVAANNVAKWDGSAWSALGSGLNGYCEVLAVRGTNVYAAGNFASAGGVSANKIAMWDGSSWSALGSGITGNYAPVMALAADDDDLFAGGSFTKAGDVGVSNIARWDGTSWHAMGSGADDVVLALTNIGHAFFAAGQFQNMDGKTSVRFAQWQPRVNVTTTTLTAAPGALTIGNDVYGFYKPALMTGSGTTVSYLGELPTSVTLDRAREIHWQGKRVNGACTFAPVGIQFAGDGAVLRVEFSEDDVAQTSGTHTEFRAVHLEYPEGYPSTREAAKVSVIPGQSAAVPVRIENGRQIYSIDAPLSEIGGTYGAIIPPLPSGSLNVTLSPDEAVTSGAKWRMDDGEWRDSSVLVSSVSIGSHSVEFKSIAGWATPARQIVWVADGLTTSITGEYIRQTGTVHVGIRPPEAVTVGAKWRVDAGEWRAGGSQAAGLFVGSHTVEFKPVTGWTKPVSQQVVIEDGTTTNITGDYVRQTGSLAVTITPASAVSAGAQWRIDGGEWRNSGISIPSLPVGLHTVEFKPVPRWNTPSLKTVTIFNRVASTETGAYVQQTGSLGVTIAPAGAVAAGAQWRVDATEWRNSGQLVSSLAVGSHLVEFKPIARWNSPVSQTIVINNAMTAAVRGTYVQQLGSLFVTIAPPAAVDAGAQWRISGGEWSNPGETVELVPGIHQVEFKTVAGWSTPAVQGIMVTHNEVSSVAGVYVPVEKSADVSVAAESSPANLILNGSLGCKATVSNPGPDPATGVVLTWSIPRDTRYVSSSTSQGNTSFASDALTAYLGTIAPGAPATVSLNVTPTTPGTFTSTARVVAEQADPDNTNNTTTLSVPVIQGDGANLISQISGTQTCRQKRSGTSCIVKAMATVSNVGSQDATNVQFQVFLSEDNVHDSSDKLLKTYSVRKLKVGKTSGRTVRLAMPPGTTASGKFLVMIADPAGTNAESNEFDNSSAVGL